MFSTNSGNIKEENKNIPHIYIVGRLDDPKVTQCRQVVEDMMKKAVTSVKFEFVLAFETPFELYRDDLFKENTDFLQFQTSPIIYHQVI
jgi:hypothetical protein